MIVGIGSDLIDVERIERAIGRERFLERVYTEGERERIRQRGPQTAAGLFAAKEAVAKALGSGFRGFFADAIEITHDELDRPMCTLHGGALERLSAIGGARIHISISHAAGLAQAFAVIED